MGPFIYNDEQDYPGVPGLSQGAFRIIDPTIGGADLNDSLISNAFGVFNPAPSGISTIAGIDSTGATSVTSIVQDAINNAADGDTLHFPAGDYLFTDPDGDGWACLIQDKRLAITGDYPGTKFIANGEFDVLRKNDTSNNASVRGAHPLLVEGIHFQMSNGAVGVVVFYDTTIGQYLETVVNLCRFELDGVAVGGRHSGGAYFIRASHPYVNMCQFEGSASSLTCIPAPAGDYTHTVRWKTMDGVTWETRTWMHDVAVAAGLTDSDFINGMGLYMTKSMNPIVSNIFLNNCQTGIWMDGGFGDDSDVEADKKGSGRDAGMTLNNVRALGCWEGVVVHYSDNVEIAGSVMLDFCEHPLQIYGNDGGRVAAGFFAARRNQSAKAKSILIRPYRWVESERPSVGGVNESGFTNNFRMNAFTGQRYGGFGVGTLDTVTTAPVGHDVLELLDTTSFQLYAGQKIYVESGSGDAYVVTEFTVFEDTPSGSALIKVADIGLGGLTSGMVIKFGVGEVDNVEFERMQQADIQMPIVHFHNRHGILYRDLTLCRFAFGNVARSPGSVDGGFAIFWDSANSPWSDDRGWADPSAERTAWLGNNATNKFYFIHTSSESQVDDGAGNFEAEIRSSVPESGSGGNLIADNATEFPFGVGVRVDPDGSAVGGFQWSKGFTVYTDDEDVFIQFGAHSKASPNNDELNYGYIGGEVNGGAANAEANLWLRFHPGTKDVEAPNGFFQFKTAKGIKDGSGNQVIGDRKNEIGALDDDTFGTPDTTITDMDDGSGGVVLAELQNNFASILAKMERIRTVLGSSNLTSDTGGHGLTTDT